MQDDDDGAVDNSLQAVLCCICVAFAFTLTVAFGIYQSIRSYLHFLQHGRHILDLRLDSRCASYHGMVALLATNVPRICELCPGSRQHTASDSMYTLVAQPPTAVTMTAILGIRHCHRRANAAANVPRHEHGAAKRLPN